ncbi:MAG: hypothetical protein V8T87_07730 [Victivallales bacterium]
MLRQTNTIGVAVTEIDNPVRMEFCERLRSLAARSGYRLLVTSLEHTGWQARNISTAGRSPGAPGGWFDYRLHLGHSGRAAAGKDSSGVPPE